MTDHRGYFRVHPCTTQISSGRLRTNIKKTVKRLSWLDLIGINLFWLGLNMRNNAVGAIFMPYLVDAFVRPEVRNTALGEMRTAGLVIAMLVQPAMGILSDRSTSRFGRRRPFIFVGVMLDLLFLTLIAMATGYWFLLAAVLLFQFSSNISHGALQGLIPDMAPEEQRGVASAVKSIFELLPLVLLGITIAPLVGAGRLNLAFLATGAILLVLMLLTMVLVKETPLKEKPDIPLAPSMLRVLGMLAGHCHGRADRPGCRGCGGRVVCAGRLAYRRSAGGGYDRDRRGRCGGYGGSLRGGGVGGHPGNHRQAGMAQAILQLVGGQPPDVPGGGHLIARFRPLLLHVHLRHHPRGGSQHDRHLADGGGGVHPVERLAQRLALRPDRAETAGRRERLAGSGWHGDHPVQYLGAEPVTDLPGGLHPGFGDGAVRDHQLGIRDAPGAGSSRRAGTWASPTWRAPGRA